MNMSPKHFFVKSLLENDIFIKKFSQQIVSTEFLYDTYTLNLKSDKALDFISFLHKRDGGNFEYLTTLCGIHYPELKKIALMIQLYNLEVGENLRLKIYLPEKNPTFPTLTNIFKAANWMERETYDFFGVNFIGHPNLKRILNVEDMLMFPLRKEYPLEDQSRLDKDNSMFGR